MPQFEYYTLDLNPKGFVTMDIDWAFLNRRLRELGEDGWELVSDINILSNGFTQRLYLIFKRVVV